MARNSRRVVGGSSFESSRFVAESIGGGLLNGNRLSKEEGGRSREEGGWTCKEGAGRRKVVERRGREKVSNFDTCTQRSQF